MEKVDLYLVSATVEAESGVCGFVFAAEGFRTMVARS